jgi:CRISPR/Cas system-associated exonuclease Cas4 (RecB family)
MTVKAWKETVATTVQSLGQKGFSLTHPDLLSSVVHELYLQVTIQGDQHAHGIYARMYFSEQFQTRHNHKIIDYLLLHGS